MAKRIDTLLIPQQTASSGGRESVTRVQEHSTNMVTRTTTLLNPYHQHKSMFKTFYHIAVPQAYLDGGDVIAGVGQNLKLGDRHPRNGVNPRPERCVHQQLLHKIDDRITQRIVVRLNMALVIG